MMPAILNERAFRMATMDIHNPEELFKMEQRITKYLLALPSGDAHTPKPVMKNGGLTVDAIRCEVTLDGEPVVMTKKRFDLLYLFIKNIGRTLSQREILQEVWGPAYCDDLQYLRVYISALRGVLKDNKDNPRFIKNVPQHGYLMLQDGE